jgi:hypothetical protein
MSDRIRLTITVTPEVHEVFTRMAEASGMSLGRTMGEWLSDTVEGAQFVAQKMEDAKRQPRLVMRELQGMLQGTREELDALAVQMRKGGLAGDGRAAAATGRAASPPSSNTGGKVPRGGAK